MDRIEILYKHVLPGMRGIEIGACHSPLPVHYGVDVTYVDRHTMEELRSAYRDPSMRDLRHVVDDAETLSKFPDSSQDFVATSHVLEHAKDPIGTLLTWIRVTRPGGIIYAAVPLKDECFDRKRDAVSIEHLLACHAGPFQAEPHYREYLSKVDNLSGESLEAKIKENLATDYNIHFHAFNEKSWCDLFTHFLFARPGHSYEVLESHVLGHEMVWVLKRS